MSDYPSAYGMYGAQEHSQAPSYLPPQPYPHYGMQTQPDGGRMGQAQAQAQGNMSSSYDASGYGYNVPPAPVPAPSFSASTLAAGVPPLPIYQGWNQDSMPLPPFNPNNNPQYMGYADTNAQNAHHNSQYYVGQPNQSNYQPSHQTMTQASQPYDEGEVSESELRATSHQMNNHVGQHGVNQYDRNDYSEPNSTYNGTAAQAAQRAYQPANGYNAPRDPPQSRVPPSDGYFPYASPKGPEYPGQQAKGNNHNPRANNHTRGRGHDGIRDKTGGRKNTAPKVLDAQPSANAAGTPTSADTAKQQNYIPPPPASSAQVPSATVSKSLADARKKAQSAVLNLLPYGIRYQNYVDEGIKEELVGRIFDDLRQPRGPIKAAEGTSNGVQMGSHQPSTSNPMNGKNGMVNGAGLPKLAAIQTTSAGPTTAVMTEKERTLQSKMEALRKSREERAQKAAAKSIAKSPIDATSPTLIQSQPSAVAPPAKALVSELEPALPSLPARPNVAIPSQSPKQVVNPPPHTPAIPGLFLTSTSSAPSPAPPPIAAPSTLAATAPPPSNHRKRPVAADFEQPLPVSTLKRPFGHSRNEQPLVIDVSEDEPDSDDEDVEMDLESQADQDSPSQPVRKLSENRAGAFSNLPGFTDFSRKPFSSPPSSATNTPLVSQNAKLNIGRPEVLQRKESEIEQLKKKIAEAEAKRKARQTPTGGQTPRDANTQGVDGKESNVVDIASKVEASMKMQQLIGAVDDKVHSDQQKLVETHVAEAANEAVLKKQEEERKRLRLQRIASDLPRVDAQVQHSQTKLEQLRAEMARLEEEVQKNLEAKRQMAEEMERLGRETDQQLQEQREKLQDLTQEEIATYTASTHLSNTENESSSAVPGPFINEDRRPEPTQDAVQSCDEAMREVSEPEQPAAPTPSRNSAIRELVSEAAAAETTNIDASVQQAADPKQQVSTDRALETALQEAVRAEADSHAQGYSDTEMDNSFAPDPSQLAPESCSNPANGEIHSPEYTPAPGNITAEDIDDGDSDIYEPPEATPPVDMPSPIESPPFSPAPPAEVIESAVADVPAQVSDESKTQGVQEIVLRDEPSRAVIPQAPSKVEDKPEQVQLFKPYQSPLKYFRAFRFHPTYKQEVAGGLRSLTFSNKIDPQKEFCKYELAGGICNDATCEFQHFKEIVLPDDAVLTTLGSPDQFNDEQREKFCAGLRGVLTDLRARKIKDFDVIASEIIAHRSKFLGDNSKILNLEDTSI